MKQQHEISATVQAILGTQVRKKFWHHQGRFSSVSVVATGRMMALAGALVTKAGCTTQQTWHLSFRAYQSVCIN